MRKHRSVGSRRALKGGGIGAALALAGVLLAQVPLTSAAFTRTTDNAGSAFGAAASFCVPGGTTATVLNDTMVVQKDPTGNYGAVAPLEVRSHLNDNKRLLLRPALPALPAHCTLQTAVLKLKVTNFRVSRTYDVYAANTNWVTGSVTWNTQPGVTGTPASGVVTNTATWQVDIAGPLLGLYANGPGGNYGVIVKDRTEDTAADNNNKFDSLDGTTPAVVTYTWA